MYKRQNIDTNLEILHYLPKGRKLNTTEQYEIYNHHTTQPNDILNDQLQYKSHTLFDTILQKTNIKLNPRANPLPPHTTPTTPSTQQPLLNDGSLSLS